MLNILFLEGKSIFTATFLPYKRHNIEYQLLTDTMVEFADKEEIIDDLNVCAQYDIFNLNGIREPGKSECLSKGFYIIRNGNITKKIVVK